MQNIRLAAAKGNQTRFPSAGKKRFIYGWEANMNNAVAKRHAIEGGAT